MTVDIFSKFGMMRGNLCSKKLLRVNFEFDGILNIGKFQAWNLCNDVLVYIEDSKDNPQLAVTVIYLK